MSDEKLRVIRVEPGKRTSVIEIEDKLEAMQKLVGGMIEEYMPWEDDVAIIPALGDIIFFDWGADGTRDHVGFVERCDGKTVYTIEGNTSDMCARRQYPVGSSQIYGYGVPKY